MGSRIIATFDVQGAWILFAHPTKRITPNKMKKVHEKKMFHTFIIPFLLENLQESACLRPEDRYANLRLRSISFSGRKEMVRRISFILANVIFLFGCVLDRPITKEPEKRVLQVDASEKQDALAEKLKSLNNPSPDSGLRSKIWRTS